jgi:hypothetical protein
MDVTQYRKTYFALLKKLGVDDELRHEFNHAQTGKWSTSEFTVDDWRLVVSELQRRAGQNVQPGQPHIRGQRGGTPGGMISPAQLEMLASLAGQVAWRIGPDAFVRSRLLSPARKLIWSGRYEDLFRSEAANVITAFKRMSQKSQQAALAE